SPPSYSCADAPREPDARHPGYPDPGKPLGGVQLASSDPSKAPVSSDQEGRSWLATTGTSGGMAGSMDAGASTAACAPMGGAPTGEASRVRRAGSEKGTQACRTAATTNRTGAIGTRVASVMEGTASTTAPVEEGMAPVAGPPGIRAGSPATVRVGRCRATARDAPAEPADSVEPGSPRS